MRRLAAVGLTTREACGNSVRNVTACPLAGVCRDQTFDVTPYSAALANFLLGHDDVQDFGRKFKVAFSGCEHHACALVNMHDLGFLARTREVDGELQRGFTIYVGGGLGTVPHQAQVLEEFALVDEILPISQAVSRVFARLGEKRNRNRGPRQVPRRQRGHRGVSRLVREERAALPHDDSWTDWIDEVPEEWEKPLRAGMALNGADRPEGFDDWYLSNVYRQRQPGYSVVTVNLPLGDITSWQMRQLADIARDYVSDNVRTTVEQNIVLRWVRRRTCRRFTAS